MERAGSEAYGRRWGAYALVKASVSHYEELCAMHGRRRTIHEFPTFLVLRALAEATDAKRLQDWVSHYLQKQPGKQAAV